MLNYVRSFYRVHGRGLLCIAFCAFVVPLSKADVVIQNNIVYWAINYDGCSPVTVTMEYTVVWADTVNPYWNEDVGGHYVNGPFTATLKPGENILNAIGSASDLSLQWVGQNTIISGPSGAPTGSLPAESGSIVFGSSPCSESYSAVMPNPCANANNGCNTVDQFAGGLPQTSNHGSPYGQTPSSGYGITNNSAEPEVLPNGDVLQPGQGTNYSFNYSEDSSNAFSTSSLNNQGDLETNANWLLIASNDTGQITLQNPNVGANASDLLSSNGPVIWQSGMSQTQVDEAGFSALANGQNQQMNELQNEFSNLINNLNHDLPNTASNSAGGSSSNVWVENWPSNFNNGSSSNGTGVSSNVWVQNWPLTNEGIGQISNMLVSQTAAGTNAGYSMVSPFSGASGPVESGISSSIQDENGGDNLGDITVGDPSQGTITFALVSLPPDMTAYYSSLRGLIAWAIIVGSLLWNCKFAFNCLSECLRTSGSRGVSTGPLTDQLGGMGVMAILASSLVLSLVVTLPVLAVGLMSGELSFLPATTSASTFMGGAGASLQWIDQIFPVWVLVSTCGLEIAYFFAVRSFCLVLMMAIKFIPGA